MKPRYDPERVGQRLVSWESTLGARAFPRYNARAWTKRTTAHARRILTNSARVEILRSSPDQRARNYSYDLSLIIDAPTRDISRARGKFLPWDPLYPPHSPSWTTPRNPRTRRAYDRLGGRGWRIWLEGWDRWEQVWKTTRAELRKMTKDGGGGAGIHGAGD